MDEPKTQVEEAKEQIKTLLQKIEEDPTFDPHLEAAAKEFGRLQTEYFLRCRDLWWKFQEDMRTKVFKKSYGTEEKK